MHIFKRVFIIISSIFLLINCTKEFEKKVSYPTFLTLHISNIKQNQSNEIVIYFSQSLIPKSVLEIEKYNSLNANEIKSEPESLSSNSRESIEIYLKTRINIENAEIESFNIENNRAIIKLQEYSIPWGSSVYVRILPIVPYWGEHFVSDKIHKEFAYELPKYTSKVANWTPVKGIPKFIGNIGIEKYSNVIGKKPYYLLFDQPVDLNIVKKFITVSDKNGKLISIKLDHPKNSSNIFKLDVRDTYIISVTIDQDLSFGDELELKLPSWDQKMIESDPKFKVLKLKYMNQLKLEIKAPSFNNGKMENKTKLDFNFSYMIDEKDFIKQLSIEPAPISKQIYKWSLGTMAVQLSLEPGTEYKIKLPTDFTDISGSKLSKPAFYKFTTHDLATSFIVPVKPITLESTKIRIPVKGVNYDYVNTNIYNLHSSSYIKLLKSNKNVYRYSLNGDKDYDSDVVTSFKSWDLNTQIVGSVNINKENINTDGFKIITMESVGSGSKGKNYKKRVLANITDIGITAKVSTDEVFVWLSSFSTGESLANRNVYILDSYGVMKTSGTTDKNGIVTLYHENKGSSYILVDDKAIMKLDKSQLTSPWIFNLPGINGTRNQTSGTVFTERGVYRPDESVFLKLYLYSNNLSNAQIVIRDPKSETIFNRKISLDNFNSADYKVDLPKMASIGRYDVLITNNDTTISTSFRVEEYRVPTFLVKLFNKDTLWKANIQFDVDLLSTYYHGGIMGNRSFTWKVSRYPHPLTIPSLPDYQFQSESVVANGGLYDKGEGILNTDGKSTISITPKQDINSGRMEYIIEASVTDNDRQTYSSKLKRIVDPALLYIGIKKPVKQVIRSGKDIRIPFIVANSNKAFISNRVKVKVERINYHTTVRNYNSNLVQVLNRKVGNTVYEKSIKSNKTPVDFIYKPKESGIYRFTFLTTDKNGDSTNNITYFTVTGDQLTAWPRFDLEKIDITKDKQVYKGGDIAVLVPNTPYKSGTILVTIENDKVIESKIVKYDNNTPEITIPIKSEFAPNIYVSMVVIRERKHYETDAVGYETGAPGFRIGYVELEIDTELQRLDVNIDYNITSVSPGDKVKIPVEVKDSFGKGSESQLTVMIVDEAVLNMTNYSVPNPLTNVYKKQYLGIRTGSNWLDLPHSRRERLEVIFPGGDVDITDFSDRSDLDSVLRNLFKSTAYWNPNILTDKNGKAVISFTMPDNLTTYRVMVIAADKNKRFGSDSQKLISQKPLMIQPVIPRFLYTDDELTIEAMVFNNSDKTEKITVSADFVGVTLLDSREKSVTVAPGKSTNVPFSIKAGRDSEAKITFKAKTVSNTDLAEYTLPLMQFKSNIKIYESVRVSQSGKVSLTLPDNYLKDSLNSTLEFSTTSLTELKGAVDYLMQYPHGCIEQTTSIAYPLVVLRDLLPMIGIDTDPSVLKEYAEAGIKRILTFQTKDGGLSYWPGDKTSHAFGTGFGAMVLISGKESGYKVPQQALTNLGNYMEKSLRSGNVKKRSNSRYVANGDTRAFYTMLLGRLGRPQIQHINSLWDKKVDLTSFGLSFLAIANSELRNSDETFSNNILDEILKRSNSDSDNIYFESELEGGWSMNSPIRTQGATIVAFNNLKKYDITLKLIKGLLDRKRGALWGSTQSNVFAIMGIYEAMGRVQDNNDSSENFSISLNDKSISISDMQTNYNSVKRIKLSKNETLPNSGKKVTAEVSNSKSPGVLSLYVNYSIPLEFMDKSATSIGFEINRTYEDINGNKLNSSKIKLGDLVVIRINVKSKTDKNYVAISDRLPAGLEPLNMSLETSENVEIKRRTKAMEKALSLLSYQEMRDHMISFYVDDMPNGEYEFVYFTRATTPGKFLRPYANVEAMYDVDEFANTSTDVVIINK